MKKAKQLLALVCVLMILGIAVPVNALGSASEGLNKIEEILTYGTLIAEYPQIDPYLIHMNVAVLKRSDHVEVNRKTENDFITTEVKQLLRVYECDGQIVNYYASATFNTQYGQEVQHSVTVGNCIEYYSLDHPDRAYMVQAGYTRILNNGSHTATRLYHYLTALGTDYYTDEPCGGSVQEAYEMPYSNISYYIYPWVRKYIALNAFCNFELLARVTLSNGTVIPCSVSL